MEPERGGGPISLDELLREADYLRYEGNYEAAEEIYKKILSIAPDNAAAHCGLGLVYCFHEGRFEESLEELRKAVDLDPQNVTYRLHLAKTLTMLAYYEEAKAEFERVLELDPSNEEAIKQLGYFAEWGV
ncbi:MAG: tetratricopeptide repeat protein [Armatimonadetes bacterium]|nr:tetratricopeptide repeat protein [Armatimonadota bacterium]MDW8121056.1 tetratricopeptide repeat protein [Armatimonadota bacterium]